MKIDSLTILKTDSVRKLARIGLWANPARILFPGFLYELDIFLRAVVAHEAYYIRTRG